MEGDHQVYLGNRKVGNVQVRRQGLYYHIQCRCRIPEGVYRLYCAEENLGVLAPVGDSFGLDRRIPVKRLAQDGVMFYLQGRQCGPDTLFVPIVPEEPFRYLDRLKTAYLAKREGQAGAVIRV